MSETEISLIGVGAGLLADVATTTASEAEVWLSMRSESE